MIHLVSLSMADNKLVGNSSRFSLLATNEDFVVEASSHFWQTAQTYLIVLDSCHESPNISHYPQEQERKKWNKNFACPFLDSDAVYKEY